MAFYLKTWYEYKTNFNKNMQYHNKYVQYFTKFANKACQKAQNAN